MAFGDESQFATASSNMARRHMSTRGKSWEGGRESTRLAVAAAHEVSIGGVAGIVAFLVATAEAVLSGKRDLRYGTTTVESVCLAGCSALELAAPSMKEANLVATASRAGT